MGCSSQKNAQVDEPDNEKNNNKKDKKSKESPKKKETKNENEEDDDFEEEEVMEMDENGIEKLKKKHMINEYIFYPTKDIPKRRFVKKDIDKVLPSDFAGKEKSDKDKQYFCFQKKVNKNKTKKYKFTPDDESEKNNPIKDEIYHFNQHLKQAKAVRPLKREEIVKPYNYQYEYKLNDDDQLLEKKSNKGKEKYEYLDMFPNGEAYKFINSDDEQEENKKEKNKIDKAKIEREKENEAKRIELINQNDQNNIANIINKELKENNLLDGDKKAGNNANDF